MQTSTSQRDEEGRVTGFDSKSLTTEVGRTLLGTNVYQNQPKQKLVIALHNKCQAL